MLTLFLFKFKGKEFTILLYSIIIEFLICFNFFGFFISLLILFIEFLSFLILSLILIKSNSRFDVFFGYPGSGKSTIATDIAIDSLKKNIPVFTMNLDIPGCNVISSKDSLTLDNPHLHNCVLIIDESGIDFNNRNFKTNFSQKNLEFFKYHRHVHVDIYIFSQGWDDMDKKLRDLATRLFSVSRSLIPFFIVSRKMIRAKTEIDSISHEPFDGYKFAFFGSKYCFMPKTWKHFNSFSKK